MQHRQRAAPNQATCRFRPLAGRNGGDGRGTHLPVDRYSNQSKSAGVELRWPLPVAKSPKKTPVKLKFAPFCAVSVSVERSRVRAVPRLVDLPSRDWAKNS